MVMLFVKPESPKQAKDIRSLPPLQKIKHMDWAGTIIFPSAFVYLYLALQWGGQTKSWRSSEVIGLSIGFGLLLGLFAYTQNFTGKNSLIPRRILKQRPVLFGTIYLVLFGLQMAVVSNPPFFCWLEGFNIPSIYNIHQYISRLYAVHSQ